MAEKSWYKSKTIWFNAVTTLLMFASLSEVEMIISPKWIAIINGVGNIILRVWFTSQPVTK